MEHGEHNAETMEHGERSVETNSATPAKTGPIRKIWRGDHPLWLHFWVLYIGAGLGIMIFWSNLGKAVARPDSPLHNLSARLGPALWLLIASPLFMACCLYLLIALVGAWRSAKRYEGWRIWRWLAWSGVIFGAYQLTSIVLLVLDSILA
ncbi:MAG: hypothetical protein LBC10_01630 [Deltaproteobacteria bacterium]|jgi:hypothetical protein|nr:hypothetical protein [Deltaproteobacteria bacterium]